MSQDEQGQFNFGAGGSEDGLDRWQADRRRAMRALARKMNLPVDHEVEVWLRGGVLLRGKLRLRDELLFVEEDRIHELELAIDKATFKKGDIESCVRMD